MTRQAHLGLILGELWEITNKGSLAIISGKCPKNPPKDNSGRSASLRLEDWHYLLMKKLGQIGTVNSLADINNSAERHHLSSGPLTYQLSGWSPEAPRLISLEIKGKFPLIPTQSLTKNLSELYLALASTQILFNEFSEHQLNQNGTGFCLHFLLLLVRGPDATPITPPLLQHLKFRLKTSRGLKFLM